MVVWGVWLGVASTPGCQGVSAEEVCNTVCDCTGCDEDDCVDDLEDAEDEAKDEKCEDDYSAYVECIQNKMDCDDDHADFSDCKDEADDLADCIEKKNMPFKSPCADLKRQCKDCGEKELCEATVDLVEEVGGEEACEDLLDEGGINCDDEEEGGGGAGGGNPSSCDDGTVSSIDSAACDTCFNCALEGACASETASFQSMPGAQAYLDCMGPCTTDACINGCGSAYPSEESAYIAVLSCAVCYECAYNCDAATNCGE